jgi:ankyrin repeat protein
LVEEGKATLDVRDRWGNTPLDEARRVGQSVSQSVTVRRSV